MKLDFNEPEVPTQTFVRIRTKLIVDQLVLSIRAVLLNFRFLLCRIQIQIRKTSLIIINIAGYRRSIGSTHT